MKVTQLVVVCNPVSHGANFWYSSDFQIDLEMKKNQIMSTRSENRKRMMM